MTTDTPDQTPNFRVMTFTPSKEEFKDFVRYVAFMESQGAHRAGIAKIIPPKGWKPRHTYDDIDDLLIPAPIQQVVTGQSGLFTQYNIQKKPMTVVEFQKTSNLAKFCSPRYVDFDELERKFWKNLTFNPPLYGADVSGTLFDPDVSEWNMANLNTILDTVESESAVKIKGLTTPCLYFGMWKSAFPWHTEDMNLYSICYLHYGEPKSWYVVPPEHGRRLERLAKGFFPGNAQSCEAFLRHKMTLISPSILKKYGIPYEKVTQEAGQFIVTFPFAYHAGFNHGFNCAESTNFATQRWIDYGKQAKLCSCRQDMVKISMDAFVRKFQPDRYKLWKAGKDDTPIDHVKPTPEASEFLKKEKASPCKKVSSEASSEEPTSPAQKDKSSDLQSGKKRPLEPVQTSEGDNCDVRVKEAVEPESPKLSMKSSPNKVPAPSAQPKSERQLEKHMKPPPKCISKANKKTSNRLISARKDKSGGRAADMSPLLPVEGNAEGSVEPRVETSNIPVHKLFQRTLSPADVLHVHSYAKGDYGEEIMVQEEEQAIRSDKKEDTKHQVAEVLPPDAELESNPDQLPRPPHIKDNSSEKDVLEELPPVEAGTFEGDNWAKPLTHLWQSSPPNLKKEREYNQRMGSKPPYCSICMLFQTYQQAECARSVDSHVAGAGGRMQTKPLIPEMCFTITTEEDAESEEQPIAHYLEEDGTSLLISCSQCSVWVHASCYGVNPASVSTEWKCARCKANAMNESCCLCLLRGGALHKTTNDKWVHVLCAVAVMEARFVNIAERSPVDLSGIPLQRFKLKCYYCKKRVKKASGCCVQCSHGRCPTAYHPTCAQAAGVLMQPDDWPFVVHVTCCRHKGPAQIERNKAAMHELTVGQKVICKHKNGRYYQCDVVQLSKETFYEVNFDDGSFSDNLFPEDIVNQDCAQLGPPPQGEVVQVRWTDGLVYGAKFVAAHVIQMYLVEFEDGSQLTAKRDDVYTLDEELPKRVKSRLSKASDMRFDGIFEDNEIIQESKRQRVINSRYRGDYIEPVIYRAIME
ncbi:lysine-specific demethylase 4A isoform X1 [Xiphophorus maculatus]|uniref:lysine-specific demethylase 4A isoform X1 n=1 Tax=Xiphophorus maculatus TaxID=8083 RepID=UPI0003B6721A|nr:lysine-specific demethylase 4A isoform X1 [Xiphophorus maculatus]